MKSILCSDIDDADSSLPILKSQKCSARQSFLQRANSRKQVWKLSLKS